PGTDELGIECWEITEVGVVHVELETLDGLNADRRKAAADPGPRSRHCLVARWTVRLQCLINRKEPFVEEPVFEEDEGRVNFPTQQVQAGAGGAGVAEVFVAAALEIDEASADLAMGIVAPRGRVGRRSKEYSGSRARSNPGSEIASINGVQA